MNYKYIYSKNYKIIKKLRSLIIMKLWIYNAFNNCDKLIQVRFQT